MTRERPVSVTIFGALTLVVAIYLLTFHLSLGSSLVYALWGLLVLTRTGIRDFFDRYPDSLIEEE